MSHGFLQLRVNPGVPGPKKVVDMLCRSGSSPGEAFQPRPPEDVCIGLGQIYIPGLLKLVGYEARYPFAQWVVQVPPQLAAEVEVVAPPPGGPPGRGASPLSGGKK